MAKNADACGELETENARKTAASKIFDTARDLFYRRGVRAVGVDEIVCEAGVTKPSLYRAFKSKDDLVAACLRESGREGREAIAEVLAKAGDDPRIRLDALVRHYADKLAHPDFRGCLMSNVAVELPEPGHPGREVLEECKAEMRATFLGLARDLDVADPEGLSDGLILVIEGAIATYHVFGSQGPAHSMLMTCNAVIEANLRRKAGIR
ncbi:TetR/AcrR family transcriptional regulator [Novosphingobium anseongense]|uniref:TetR/AcrR family transcriptional regulator n=1 Tax=Novosphingobium anseongense TaxID=3133436 RepID=UPI003A8E30B1